MLTTEGGGEILMFYFHNFLKNLKKLKDFFYFLLQKFLKFSREQ
jgi:hypothetical protein